MRYTLWIFAKGVFDVLRMYCVEEADVFQSKEEAERVRVVKPGLKICKITIEEDDK